MVLSRAVAPDAVASRIANSPIPAALARRVRDRLGKDAGGAQASDPAAGSPGKGEGQGDGQASGQGAGGPAPGSPEARAIRLIGSGIFDRDFYERSVGERFSTAREAAAHLVRWGMQRSFMPNHLLDLVDFPPAVRTTYRNGDVPGFLAYLRSEAAATHQYSVLFDPRRLPGTPDQTYRAGLLGWYLRTSDQDTPLPVPAGYRGTAPTLGESRAVMVRTAEIFHAQRMAGLGDRVTRNWDAAAEQEFLAAHRDHAFPQLEGPLVSVVMPVRNRPGLVARAIASIQEQTFGDWEALVVDDGSDDETPEVIEALSAADPRVRLIRRDPSGVCAARNAGVSRARGRYLAFLDSDNVWRPEFLGTALAAMEQNNWVAAYAAAVMHDGSGDQYRGFPGGRDHLMVKNHIDLNTLVARTYAVTAFGGFDESLRRWVDHDLVLELAARHEIHYMPFLGCEYEDFPDVERITTRESGAWQFAVLGKHWTDWKRVEAELSARDPEMVSVVIPTYQDFTMTIRAVGAALDGAGERPIEVVVVDNGSFADVSRRLNAAFCTEPRVRILRLPRNLNFAVGCNVGFAHARGQLVMFLNNDTIARPGWLEPLVARMADLNVRAVQPLLVFDDDTIQSAGTVFPTRDGLAAHFLTDHPPEDACRVGAERFHAVTAAAMLVRACEFTRLRGFDPLFLNGMEDVDYCLRATEEAGGYFVVEPDSSITHLESRTPGRGDHIPANRAEFMRRWQGRLPGPEDDRFARFGFEVARISGDGLPIPVPRLTLTRRPLSLQESPPRLRWGLKLPAIPGAAGDQWGDTHFADSLARALRRRGQEVVTYRHGAHDGPASGFDDVTLGLRGLDRIGPVPGKVNLLWVISHPELVEPGELTGFDRIFAASPGWAERTGERIGRTVHPLLQCVDAEYAQRARELGAGERDPRPVFVGGRHVRRERPIVAAALEAGVDPLICGPGWDGVVPAAHRGPAYVDNAELLALYRTHRVVLADHWAEMAEEGFLANRLFDVVAAGGRVICDKVEGVEIFSGAVQTYETPEDLARLCGDGFADAFPSDQELDAIGEKVAAEHSFDARAQELLDAAVALHRREGRNAG